MRSIMVIIKVHQMRQGCINKSRRYKADQDQKEVISNSGRIITHSLHTMFLKMKNSTPEAPKRRWYHDRKGVFNKQKIEIRRKSNKVTTSNRFSCLSMAIINWMASASPWTPLRLKKSQEHPKYTRAWITPKIRCVLQLKKHRTTSTNENHKRRTRKKIPSC